MKKKTIILIFVFILLFAIIIFPYLKAEYLTYCYGEEFVGLEQQTQMMDGATYLKVVDYSKNRAQVFYVLSGKGGCVITFDKEVENWKIATWKMIWSHYGSADEFFWPYYK